jgi:outer membrane immunogenic protein
VVAPDRSGGLVGGQIGYRWQTNQFVFGLEAQGDWADIKNTRVSLVDPLISTTGKTDAIGLFTAQLGWAWNASLLYVKGGAAVTHNRLDVFNNFTGVGLDSASHTRWGGALGVGWEYGFTPNWTVGVEYDHLWMGNDTRTFVGAGLVTPCGVTLVGERFSQDVDMVTVRLNYRFGGYGSPARY